MVRAFWTRRVGPALTWMAGAAVGWIVIVAGVHFSVGDYLHRRDFDAALWRQPVHGTSESDLRRHMVDVLMDRSLLAGLTRSGVVALLGPDVSRGAPKGGGLVYRIGSTRGTLGPSIDILVILFDSDDRVRSVVRRVT